MIKNLKNSLAILMVAILLLPSIVKIEHHHDHFVCNVTAEKHYHNYEEKCEVCKFEFSFFVSEDFSTLSETLVSYGVFTNNYKVGIFLTKPSYTFLLRGPPTSGC